MGPLLGTASVVGAIGMLAADEARMANIHQTINDTDPKQKIIAQVLGEMYSSVAMLMEAQNCSPETREEIRQLEATAPALNPSYRKAGINMKLGYYGLMLKKWCDKFGVRFNPYGIVLHSPRGNEYEKPKVVDQQAVEDRIRAEIAAYDKAVQEAQEKFDALPWHKKINWGGLIGFICFTLFFGYVGFGLLTDPSSGTLGPIFGLACWGLVIGSAVKSFGGSKD